MMLNIGDVVTVTGWRGVAFHVQGPTMVDDEDTVWTGYQSATGDVDVVMIGDDRVWHVDPDDCTPLADDAFCRECGQIGCTHDVAAQ
jgi:hypothetical protein